MVAGIVEFATATIAVYLAWQRTRAVERPTTRTIRWTGRALAAAYPLLGFAYLTDRLGALVEPIFFVCFSVMVAVELTEPDRAPGAGAAGAGPIVAAGAAGAGGAGGTGGMSIDPGSSVPSVPSGPPASVRPTDRPTGADTVSCD